MADEKIAPRGGLIYKGQVGEVAASEETVQGTLHTAQVLTDRVLGFAERNPAQFYVVLGCVMGWVLIQAVTRIKLAPLKREYADRRLEPRGQIPLPLPKPGSPSGEK